MKYFRFIVFLIASFLLWACQSASTVTLDKSESKISASSDPTMAIDCKTGRALTSPAPAEVGLGAASLEHRGDLAVVTFNFPRSTDLAESFAAAKTPYFGSIGFIDSSLSLPRANPNWYFDSRHNRGRTWFYDPGTRRFESFPTYFKDNKWTHVTESTASVTASGPNLIMTFPWSEVAGSVWYVLATDPSVCTALGLGADGKPNLPVPEGRAPGVPMRVAPATTPTLTVSTPTPVIPIPTIAKPTPVRDAEEPVNDGY